MSEKYSKEPMLEMFIFETLQLIHQLEQGNVKIAFQPLTI